MQNTVGKTDAKSNSCLHILYSYSKFYKYKCAVLSSILFASIHQQVYGIMFYKKTGDCRRREALCKMTFLVGVSSTY